MSDIFEETEENLRADKWMTIVKTGWPWVAGVLGIALAGALAVWGFQSWQTHVALKASEAYQAGLDAVAKQDKVTATAKFTEAAKEGNSAYKAMSYLELGSLASDDKKIDEAIKDFDIAAKATNSPLISDVAAYKAALLDMDKATFAEVSTRLTPLTRDGRPIAALAKEALAMAKLQAGDVKGAREDLEVLSVTLGTPDGVKTRAAAFVESIDSGATDTVKSLMKSPEAELPAMAALQQPSPDTQLAQ